MPHKKKADCTPEEWEAILAYKRTWAKGRTRKENTDPDKWAERMRKKNERRVARKARGDLMPSEQREYLKARNKAWKERHKDTERYKFLMAQRAKRAVQKNPEAALERQRKWRRENPERLSEARRRYRERKKAGIAPKVQQALTGERVYALTQQVLRGKYDEPTRMDIASEAMLAFLEGDATSIKDAVALGMKRHWRLFSKFTTRSLDAEIAEGLRLIDLIADDAPRAGYAA